MVWSVCPVGAGAHYRGWLYGLCAEKPPGAVLLLGGVYAVLVSLGRYVWVSVGKYGSYPNFPRPV